MDRQKGTFDPQISQPVFCFREDSEETAKRITTTKDHRSRQQIK
jgi:hypothetical protein